LFFHCRPDLIQAGSNPIQFKVLSARFYPHWLNHRNAVLFRETNPANSRRTPDTTLTCRRRGHETHSEKSLTRLMTHKNKQRKRSDIQQSNSDKSRAGNLGIDLVQAIRDKLAHNAAKYPVSRSKDSAAKYTEL
jgi:hypothetical protein